MLIRNLQPFVTNLSRIKEIPDTFFANIDSTDVFNNSLLPDWLTNNDGSPAVFSQQTELRAKFKAIFDKYKAIDDDVEKQRIITAYFDTNKIIELCNNEAGITNYELNDIHESIRNEIDNAFLYLYNNALKNTDFEVFVNDNLKNSLKRFTDGNGIEICPFCGLEIMLQMDGQPRLPLDHWLNKDRFPFASINFANLIPIGKDCNSNGVKGSKNVLKDENQRNRIKAYYPYANNNGTIISISCIAEPNVDNIHGIWTFQINPREEDELELFKSWNYIFNISERYSSYFYDILLPNWKKRYIEFINNEDDDIEISHAQNIDEFKANLRGWKRTFFNKRTHASIIFKRFIDYLLIETDDAILFGIVESFKSQVNANVI